MLFPEDPMTLRGCPEGPGTPRECAAHLVWTCLDRSQLELIASSLKLLELVATSRNLSELVATCRNLSELVATCRNLSGLPWP